MATDISKVNNVVEITQTGKSKRSYANCPAEYIIINSGATLSLKIGADTHTLAMTDLTIGGVAPSDTPDAYTKLSVVFPNPGGGGTGSTTAVADLVTISGDGSEATPFAVINPLIDTDEQKWNDSFALAAGGTSRIVSGAAPWDSGLVFNVIGTVYPELVYYILGTRFTATPTQKTLAAADATNPRIDVIYFDTSSAVGVLTGTPAANPAKPTVDSNTQVELTSITVPANATTPNVTGNLTVYNENTEFTVASTNGTLNANATANPASGTKHISIGSFTNNQNITFTDTALHDRSQFQYFTFRIRLGATFTNTTFLSVRFANGSSAVSNDINIATGTFGWTRTVVGSYQFVSIPIDRFTFTNSQFNRIYFILHGSNTTGFAVDSVVLQGGITIPSPNILSNALADGKMFVGKAGIATAVYGSNSVVNVLDYGADPTGATDSTAAINSARADAVSAGKDLYIPSGTYSVTTSALTASSQTNKRGIELATGLIVFGDGIGKTIITTGNNTTGNTTDTNWYPIFNGHSSSVSNVTIHDIEINGNKSNQAIFNTDPTVNPRGHGTLTEHKSVQGILIKTGADNIKIYNVYVHDCQGYGIEFFDTTRGFVNYCKLSANGNGGMGFVGVDTTLITKGTIQNSLITANNSDNISAVSCSDVSIINNEISSANRVSGSNWLAGIFFDRAKNIKIIGNDIHDNSAYGIDSSNLPLENRGSIIAANHIYQNGNGGILTHGYSNISGNKIHDNGKMSDGVTDTHSSYQPGAIVVYEAANLTITGNEVFDVVSATQTYFIKMFTGASYGFKSSAISNNRIENIADLAHAYNGDNGDNIIVGNSITDNSAVIVNNGTVGYIWQIGANGLPAWTLNSGASIPLAHFGFSRVFSLEPTQNSTTLTLIGLTTPTASGTATARTSATTNFLTQTRRIGYISSATAGNTAGIGLSNGQFWRGNAAGLGGFYFHVKFAIPVTAAGRIFCAGVDTRGFKASATAEISSLTNVLFVGLDSTDTNFQLFRNDASGTATKVDTGIAPSTTALYGFTIIAQANTTTVYMKFQDLSAGTTFEGSYTTDLPSNSQFLCYLISLSNNATASAVTVDIAQMYGEHN